MKKLRVSNQLGPDNVPDGRTEWPFKFTIEKRLFPHKNKDYYKTRGITCHPFHHPSPGPINLQLYYQTVYRPCACTKKNDVHKLHSGINSVYISSLFTR
jgi:hypothetical protein